MKLAVLGNGAWGSALAELGRRRGHAVRVWGRRARAGENAGIRETVAEAEMVLLAIPSHAMREVCEQAKPHLPSEAFLISAAKGIEQETELRPTQIIAQITGMERVLVLSGPSFAAEVARAVPTAAVCAARVEAWARRVQDALTGEDFRLYTNTDVIGVELGGALKNVMAIGAGACAGIGLGENAVAALITRGLAELARVGTALGGSMQTFYGLSGVGDLILTCSSRQSRNRRLGEALGRGEKLEKALAGLEGTAEGVRTARSVHQALQKHKLDAPILQEVYAILYDQKPVAQAVKSLMGREPKREFEPSQPPRGVSGKPV